MVQYSESLMFDGMKAIRLENARLRLTVLPEYGANLWEMYYKPAECELLWHHPNMTPRQVLADEAYDDVFFGGSHLLFPNDVPELVDGRELADHGELWPICWSYRLICDEADRKTVEFAAHGPITGVEVRKRITLGADEAFFEMAISLTNREEQPLDFMLKLHTAVNISEGDVIELPCVRSYVEDIDMEGRIPARTTYRWPVYNADGEHTDMSLIPAANLGKAELQYGLELTEGRCALHKKQERLLMEMRFDPVFFRTIWTFATYGGWRDLNMLIFEPSTGYPQWLNEARKNGIYRRLAPEQTETTIIRFSVSTF